MNASTWQPWIADALVAADVTLAYATVEDCGVDLSLLIPLPGGPAEAAFDVKKADTVKPSMIAQLHRRYRGEAQPLLVAERLSQAAVDELRRAGYSWLSRVPLAGGRRGELRVGTSVYAVEAPPEAPPVLPAAPPGRPARALARLAQGMFYRREATQKELAEESGVSQARVSQLLGEWPPDTGLRPLGGRPARWIVSDPNGLVGVWLDAYSAARRISSYWYGLEAALDQARDALRVLGGPARVSGSLAADVLAPWAVPHQVLIYSPEGRDLSRVGLAPCAEAEATLELVVTSDRAVFPSQLAEAFLERVAPDAPVPLADPLVVLADLTRSPELDARQAAVHLRTKLVEAWWDADCG